MYIRHVKLLKYKTLRLNKNNEWYTWGPWTQSRTISYLRVYIHS